VVHLGRVIAEADHIRSTSQWHFFCAPDSRLFSAMNSLTLLKTFRKSGVLAKREWANVSDCNESALLLLWRERGDDFLETRIGAKCVPLRTYFQLAVVCAVLYLRSGPQLFDSAIAVADRFINHGQI
jgi:hypothetical protein